ncbi:hypothetical protein P8452_31070 [Trifolium repens]|nr:hypothetical protein P8452_31070 [Trifolium repens]
MLWCLWKRRNEQIWEVEEKQPSVSINQTRELFFQWQHVRAGANAQGVHVTESANIWQPPPRGKLKCNIDAAIFAELNRFGVGMCLRNDHGQFVKAKTRLMEGTPPALEAEAMGLREALNWLGEIEVFDVSIELDCKPVVDSIMDTSNNHSEFGKIMSACKLLQQYPNFKISFIRRQANLVARTLARASKLYASHQVFESIPSCILPIMINESI